MPACTALNCNNSHAKGFVMLRYPKDDKLRELWRLAVGREGFDPTNSHRLCEAHFQRCQWEKFRCRLKSGAVPTLFCDCKLSQEEMHMCDSSDVPLHLLDHLYCVVMAAPSDISLSTNMRHICSSTRSGIHLKTCSIFQQNKSKDFSPEPSYKVNVERVHELKPSESHEQNKLVGLPLKSPQKVDHTPSIEKKLIIADKVNKSLLREIHSLKKELRVKNKLLKDKDKEIKALKWQNLNAGFTSSFVQPPGTVLVLKEVLSKVDDSMIPQGVSSNIVIASSDS